MSIINCSKCGADIDTPDDGAAICTECGTAHPESEPNEGADGNNITDDHTAPTEENAPSEDMMALKRKRTTLIIKLSVIGAIILAIAIALLVTLVIIPSSRYSAAQKLISEGKYTDAYLALLELDGYSDSAERAAKLRDEHPGVSQPGETVTFGIFEQDNKESTSDGIEWTVLANENGQLLLISREAIFAAPYNDSDRAIFWSDCSLRKWLNEEFISIAFTESEREFIVSKENQNPKNPEHVTAKGNGIDGGPDTTDSVFLLSHEEYKKYSELLDGKPAKATKYAEENGAAELENSGTIWWLRSPGYTNSYGACISENGYINNYGSAVNQIRGVRPVICLKMEAFEPNEK